MPTDAELGVLLTGKDQGASKVVKDLRGEVEQTGGAFSKVGSIASGFLAADAVKAGIGAVTGFIGDSIAAIKESNIVNAQLDAALKSTGASAWTSAEGIRARAAALERNSLFEDEAILNGQNLLLTFTNVQNRVGEGNDIFDQASQIMVDMAQAMGTDAAGGAIQLGKALNDPTQGITALTRVGVTFDDAQKKQIKTMQEAGDIAGAQRIILNELNKEFGGSAKAASDAAGASEKYKDRMNDLKETIGAKMLPVQEKITEAQLVMITLIADKVIPVLEELYAKHWPAIAAAIEDVGKVIETVWPVASQVIAFAADYIVTRIEGMIQAIGAIVEIVTSTVNFVSDIFHGRWAEAWGEMKDIAGAIVELFIGTLRAQFGNLPDLAYDAGQRVVTGMWDGIASLQGWLFDKVRNFAGGIFNSVKSGLGSLWPGSPSKAGIAVAEGFGLGLEAGSRNAYEDADAFAAGLASHMAPATAPASWAPGVGEPGALGPADWARRWAPEDTSMLPGWTPAPTGDTLVNVYIDGALVSRSVEKRQAETTRLAGRGI